MDTEIVMACLAVKASLCRSESVGTQAVDCILRLRDELRARDVSTMPDVVLSEEDDDSAWIGWHLPDRRFAITLEPDSSQSGWHRVALPSAGDVYECGTTAELNLKALLDWFLAGKAST